MNSEMFLQEFVWINTQNNVARKVAGSATY